MTPRVEFFKKGDHVRVGQADDLNPEDIGKPGVVVMTQRFPDGNGCWVYVRLDARERKGERERLGAGYGDVCVLSFIADPEARLEKKEVVT